MSARQQIKFPSKLEFLFKPSRYKVLYGGRGGAKSWGIARALLTLGASKPLRILCAREIQKSIADSVHKLLKDQIEAMGLSGFYEVQNAVIRGKNGTEFTFHGLKHNVSNIKSVEGSDICWVEEAQNVSKSSWETLIPTVRKPSSEIWVSFNPGLEQDETYQRFVVRPPTGAIVAKVNYSDNPWFPDVLRQEMEDLRKRSEDDYRHVWEGDCKVTLDGAIYAEEMRRAQSDGRITRVPYDPVKPVSTFWDLGYSDAVSIWCAQVVGLEWRIIDFVQSNRKPANWYVAELQKRPYVWATDWLPHDANNKTMAAAMLPEMERTIAGQLRSMGRKVRVLPNASLVDGINSVRTIFDRCWFDAEKCAEGLQSLRHYRYEVDEDTGAVSKLPKHDWCFEGSTLVLTSYGRRAIKDLPQTGEVLTPCGWKQYRNPRVTRKNAPLVVVAFADGLTVKCTPDHSFLTDSGWRYASDLTKGSLIQSTLTPSRLISMAVCTAVGRVKDIGRAAAKSCTEMFGKVPLGRFPPVATFTTATETRTITGSQTWSACPPESIFPTRGKLRAASESQKSTFPILLESGHPTGTKAMPEGFGTAGMQSGRSLGLNGGEKIRIVRSVVFNLTRWFANLGIAKNTAQRFARPLRIESVKRVNETSDVWCLTVPDGAAFSLANGAVVHNCSHAADAFRVLAMSLRADRPESEPEESYAGSGGWMGAIVGWGFLGASSLLPMLWGLNQITA